MHTQPTHLTKRLVLTLAALILLPTAAPLRTVRAGDATVTVENPRVLAVPPVSGETAAFMTLVNAGDRPVRLVGGASPIAEETAPMITTRETKDGKTVLGMKTVPALEVPARGRLELRPGGDHLMLMMLKGTLKEGEQVAITLRFEQPGPAEITFQAPVVRDASAPAAPERHAH